MTNKTIKYTVKVYPDGTKYWYLNDKLHREDGPAIELANGTTEWYLNDKLHREAGPAVEGTGGYKAYYLNDKPLTEQEHKKATTKATCDGKEVVIEGITYVLKEKQNDLALSTDETHRT